MSATAVGRMETYGGAPNRSPDDLDIVLRVIERRQESSDCVSIFFDRPIGLVFNAGDWLDIRFLDPDLAIGRTYSFSSAPTEDDLRITYRQGSSPFKKRIEQVVPGETMLITQYGSNGFLLDRRSPAVFIAGGIGIAPFRSMIKDVIDHGDDVPITVVHVNRTDAPFGHELSGWGREYRDLEVHHVSTATGGRLTMDRVRSLVPAGRLAASMFYVAGPPAMVSATERHLSGLGIVPAAIKTDSFTGY